MAASIALGEALTHARLERSLASVYYQHFATAVAARHIVASRLRPLAWLPPSQRLPSPFMERGKGVRSWEGDRGLGLRGKGVGRCAEQRRNSRERRDGWCFLLLGLAVVGDCGMLGGEKRRCRLLKDR